LKLKFDIFSCSLRQLIQLCLNLYEKVPCDKTAGVGFKIKLLHILVFSLYISFAFFSGRSLYVGVVEKSLPPALTGEQYGKMELKYHEGGLCQSVLCPQGVFNVPLYF